MIYTRCAIQCMDDPVIDATQQLSFGRQIAFARQRSQYTSHAFAQLMGIKLRMLEDFENDVVMPEKKHITKMNRFLVTKLPYPQKHT
jgi:DNA-binding transcriptional regulator YiaG